MVMEAGTAQGFRGGRPKRDWEDGECVVCGVPRPAGCRLKRACWVHVVAVLGSW